MRPDTPDLPHGTTGVSSGEHECRRLAASLARWLEIGTMRKGIIEICTPLQTLLRSRYRVHPRLPTPTRVLRSQNPQLPPA